MSTLRFDALTDVAADLDGQITEFEVLDADLDPNRVLPLDSEWSVKVNWEISGLCAPGIGGDWVIRVNLESMGEGFEGLLAEEIEPVSNTAPAALRSYERTIALPAPNTFPDLVAGTYRIVVVIGHTNTGGGVTKRTRMAGFIDGELLDFSDAEV